MNRPDYKRMNLTSRGQVWQQEKKVQQQGRHLPGNKSTIIHQRTLNGEASSQKKNLELKLKREAVSTRVSNHWGSHNKESEERMSKCIMLGG
jgi:hypothetical protein